MVGVVQNVGLANKGFREMEIVRRAARRSCEGAGRVMIMAAMARGSCN